MGGGGGGACVHDLSVVGFLHITKLVNYTHVPVFWYYKYLFLEFLV